MPKKPTKTKNKNKPLSRPQPEAAQLKAIERLMEAGEYTKVVQRLKPLVQRFPGHGGLRRLLIAASERSEGLHAAGLAAFEWAERRPSSIQAQQALLSFAVRLGLVLLADRAARQLRALGLMTPGFPVSPGMLADVLATPEGTLATVEQIECFDIGTLYLDAQDFSGAVDRLDGLEILSARNNRAMALFHLGRIDEALAGFMASWEADQANLFALGWVVRLRLYRGDEVGAQGLTIPLAGATARRLDDALLQLDALLLLRQDAAARDAFTRSKQCAWFEIGKDYPRAVLHHFAACAASRLGRASEAGGLWREALRLMPDFKLAIHNSAGLERDHQASEYPAVFDLSRALPLTWINELRAAGEEIADTVETLTAANVFLEALYLGGEGPLRSLVGLVLMHRAGRADPDAARLLKGFARLPIGTKDERFVFLRLLQEQNLIAPTDLVDYWDGNQLRQINLFSIEVHREPEVSDLPDDLQELLNASIARFNTGDHAGAEPLLAQLLARVPNHAAAKGNLAAIRSFQGRHEEAEKLLREVVADHPDYLVARCNLANLAVLDGNVDEADALLKGLATRRRIHIQDLFTLYGSMALLNRARGEVAVADSLIASLEPLVQNEDDARRLKFAKNLQKSVGLETTFIEALTALVRRPGKPSRG
ncbi:MAG: tetratricopeptide repeat protein [Thiocapsa sp.]|uniref:tetratricopeptide repeat protein n=1 Tax=Thiocapsa sp. TaxID=2024551 RepID=UPI001BD15C3B|nr:tetratricopeptide repeat protein [Thiocapsa sp.]QVL48049.1 MAG: tetratricopeptide repeat protein [Thiocapsa sp.]